MGENWKFSEEPLVVEGCLALLERRSLGGAMKRFGYSKGLYVSRKCDRLCMDCWLYDQSLSMYACYEIAVGTAKG